MTPEARTDSATRTDGRIAAIRGGVVDVIFDGPVPRIHDLLYAGEVALEVSALIGQGMVRAMAMAPVRGLGLGMTVTATGVRSGCRWGMAFWGGCWMFLARRLMVGLR